MSDFDNIINERLNEDDGEFFPRKEANWDKLSQRLAAFEAANPVDDFDKTVNNRLNEEASEFYPRRAMNWDKMSARLAEFEAANPLPLPVQTPVLTAVWKRWVIASAAAALIGVCGLLFWESSQMKSLEQQNAGLTKELVELKSAQSQPSAGTVIEQKKTVETRTTTEITKTVIAQSTKANDPNSATKSSSPIPNRLGNSTVSQKETVAPFEQKQANTPQTKQFTAVVDNKLNNNKKETGKTESSKNEVVQKRNNDQVANVDNKNVPNEVPFDKQNEPLNSQKVNIDGSISTPSVSTGVLEGSQATIVKNKPNEVKIEPKKEGESIKNELKNLDKIEVVAQTPPSVKDPILDKKEETTTQNTAIATIEKTKVDTSNKTNIVVQKDNVTAENKVTPQIIVPIKKKSWKTLLPSGFTVGVNAVFGTALPEVRGIMPTQGFGLSAGLELTKHISLTGTADFLESHFEVGDRPKKNFRPKDEPNPPHGNSELRRFKGDQHSRLLSLNAKYLFSPIWKGIRPSVFMGHSWQKIEGRPVDYVFQDITTNVETSVAVQVETEQIKGLWQAGIGLEKKIKRWTFGISAEAQRDFSNTKDVNGNPIASTFGILRGGLRFNIF